MRVLVLSDGDLNGETRADREVISSHLDPQRIRPMIISVGTPAHPSEESLRARFQFDPRTLFRLRRIVRESKIELIHGLGTRIAPLVSMAGRTTGVPTLITIYRASVPENRLRETYERLRWRLSLSGVDRITVPSEGIGRSLAMLLGERERIYVIRPGLQIEEIDPVPSRESLGLPEGALIVTLAPPDLTPSQDLLDRCDLTLDAVRHLLKRHPEAHLMVLGEGAYLESLRKTAQHYRPALPILWGGNRSNHAEIIASADVYVDFASMEMVSPGIILAAMLGKPIVAPNVPSVVEVIEPNVAGLLVEPKNSAEFAAQINRLIQYDGLSHRLGRVAQRRTQEHYSVDAQSSALVNFYETTIYTRR